MGVPGRPLSSPALPQVREAGGGAELWPDAAGVSSPRAPGPERALLRGLLLLLPLRGALHL